MSVTKYLGFEKNYIIQSLYIKYILEIRENIYMHYSKYCTSLSLAIIEESLPMLDIRYFCESELEVKHHITAQSF